MKPRDRSEDPTLQVGQATPATPGGRLAPGDIVADRYRIADLLGSGGMGQVYRADDLKLDQPVALKFLPRALAGDAIQLERLKQEVRLGRTISHPNVCRIYDLGEAGHSPFVAMELVRGEDLASLLRRIGRLPEAKGLEISRQLCSGLAAVHARGILHRDLKPANVMLDQDGHARITDFGLAVDSGGGDDLGLIVGTPAYMAPEQLRGEAATEQSDLYALGLVIHEICTGERVRTARTIEDLRRDSIDVQPLSESLDPRVRAALERCLDPDPANRPQSASQVLRMLPGGDPLAEAVAAGITPSPDVVAAAPAAGLLRPWVGWTLFASVVALLVLIVASKHQTSAARKLSLRAPAIMEDRARALLTQIGLDDGDGIVVGRYRENRDVTPIGDTAQPDPLRARRVEYFYRIAPARFRADLLDSEWMNESPTPGSVNVTLDSRGSLVRFEMIPGEGAGLPDPVGWEPFFAAAALDPSALRPVTPTRIPPAWSDQRVAWLGRTADGAPIRVEAASRSGHPLSFSVDPDRGEIGGTPPPRIFEGRIFAYLASTVLMLFLLSGAGLAWLNARRKRVDVTGTFRLALTVFALKSIAFVLIEPHSSSIAGEFGLLLAALKYGLVAGIVLAIFYMAIEPVVRRRWPEIIISWTRIVHGGWRDPLVARDVLIGMTAGLVHAILPSLYDLLGAPTLDTTGLETLDSFRHAVGFAILRTGNSISQAMIVILLLVLMLIVFRRRQLALAASFIALSILFSFAYQGAEWPVIMGLIMASLLVIVLKIAGPLGIAVMQATFFLSFHHAIAPPAPWALPTAIFVLTILLGTAIYAVGTSTGLRASLSARLDSIG